MIIGKLTGKARTTLPRAVRTALRLKEGDALACAIEGERVILTHAPVPQDDPFACFDEWAGEADRRAYAGF